MNSNLIKNLVIGIATGVAGFFTGFFIEKKKSDKRVNEIEEEFRETLMKKSKRAANKPDISELINSKEKGKEVVDELLNCTKEEPAVTQNIIEHVEETKVKPEKVKDIEIIEEDEYEELYNYTSNVLTFYQDDFLVNERGKVVANPADIIGDTALSMLRSGDKRMVYVKNNDTGSKYEIYYDYNCWLDLDEDDSSVGDFADELDE